jgi:DNA-binding beta-propeller fold protein YncE
MQLSSFKGWGTCHARSVRATRTGCGMRRIGLQALGLSILLMLFAAPGGLAALMSHASERAFAPFELRLHHGAGDGLRSVRPEAPSFTSLFGGFPGEAPTVQVGGDPVGDIVDTSTHTVYVANGNDNTISVINDAACNARTTVGCDQTPPTVTVGAGPLALALDRRTQTLYVSNFNGFSGDTVSMIDIATCNATDTAGCAQPPPTVTTGPGPQLLALDPSTDTIYVPDGGGNTVSVIDGTSCNATDQTGCGDVSSVTVGSAPSAVAVNPATHTAYVLNSNDGTMSLIDTATCNATARSGCGQSYPTVAVGPGPSAVVVDRPSETVYAQVGPTGDGSLGSVAMVNGTTCNVTNTSGCGSAPRTTPDGAGPIWMVENAATRTVYAVNQGDSDISVIDAASCNAIVTYGCRQVPPALSIGGPTSSAITNLYGAGAVAVDQSTDTLYATSQVEDNLSVLNGAMCDAEDTSGCTRFAPTTAVGNSPQGVADDPATHTVYVTNRGDDTVSVINTAVCNAAHLAGCDTVWPTVKVGNFAQDLRVDVATDTIYVVNANDNTVSVINGATCNALISVGCDQTAATVDVGNAPYALAVDRLTDTVYVANLADNTVSVIDGATCNGTHHSGCSQTPPTVAVGSGPNGVTVDQATNTVYIANGGSNTVSMIDGATCNGTYQGGCTQTPITVTVGNNPYPIAIDQRTGTVYVGNVGDGTLSLIDGRRCNATEMAGCGKLITMPVEQFPYGIAVDQRTGTAYVTSVIDSDVAAIGGRRCMASAGADCRPRPIPLRMGGFGGAIAVDPSSNTAYVPDNDDGEVSFFGLGAS